MGDPAAGADPAARVVAGKNLRGDVLADVE